jgi:hypothetical protein
MAAPTVRAGARDLLADCHRFACISECGQFRYLLSRRWAPGATLLFVMLNPSTADAMVDDATIRRCVTFANVHGYGTLEVVNLFAFRATDPRDLARMGWQVGPENDEYIDCAARNAAAVCVAWGAIGENNAAERRVQVVMPIIRAAGHAPQCLRVTRGGFPQHPLYLPSDCKLTPLDAALEAAAA